MVFTTSKPSAFNVIALVVALRNASVSALSQKQHAVEMGCGGWCASNALDWSDKCKWNGCSTCEACAPPAKCEAWCAKNAAKWSAKCTWGACSTCDDCAPAPTPAPPTPAPPTSAPTRPNVLFIICDDLNGDFGGTVGEFDFHPNIDNLAKTGVNFSYNYANHPVCAPSRTSFMTGILGQRSGVLFWEKWFKNDVLSNSRTMMEHFKANGYVTLGTGKIMHHELRFNGQWDEFHISITDPNSVDQPDEVTADEDDLTDKHFDYGPFAYHAASGNRTFHPSLPEGMDFGDIDLNFARLSEVPYAELADGSGWIYNDNRTFHYVSNDDRSLLPDEIYANWAVDKINNYNYDKPFFLAVGFTRPHTPLYCPDEYFDMFSMDEVPVNYWPEDVADTHYQDVMNTSETKGHKYFKGIAHSYESTFFGLKKWNLAYYACVAFVDAQVGKVMDALKASSFYDNTVVVFTGDNGWQHGQKDWLYKNAPWEGATHVPLIMRVPGVVSQEGAVVTHAVSLVDIYPTLIDVCGLEGSTKKNELGAELSGHSLRPFLENPTTTSWSGPEGSAQLIYNGKGSKFKQPNSCKTSPYCHHWALRTTKYRYIMYNNGYEELYDHEVDDKEHTNVAYFPEFRETKARMISLLEESAGLDASLLGWWAEERACPSYCAKNKAPWDKKCGWCGPGCVECPGAAPFPPEECPSYCGRFLQDWATKCTWSECEGCSDC